jgi:hypothetical protein
VKFTGVSRDLRYQRCLQDRVAPHPTLPGATQGWWFAIAVAGHSDEAGCPPSFDAAAGVVIPESFARAIHRLLGPGATMFVTDVPILGQDTESSTELISGRAPDSATQ